ncbi:MAG TPA: extracellular solute-binding protein, partial [Capillimicrobium sp.]
MRVTRRSLLASGALTGAGLVLGACGSSASRDQLIAQGRAAASGGVRYDGPPVELEFWNGFTGGDGPFMRDLVDQFNRENDNVRVRMNVILWVDYYQKTTAAVSSGTGPDIGVMQMDQIGTAAAHRIILPLDDVATEMGLRQEDFAAAVWDASVVAGQRFGIPLDVHPLGMYVNRALVPEATPTDRAQFLDVLADLKQEGIAGAWMSPFLFTGSLLFQTLLWQFGGELYTPGAERAAWDSDAGVEALSFMVDLVEKGYSIPDVGQDADNIGFKNGENAFFFSGCWSVNDFGATPGLKWSPEVMPTLGDQPAVWANSHNFVLMRQPNLDEDKLQASAAFIDFLSRNSAAWAKAGMVPARTAERDTKAVRKIKPLAPFVEEIPDVRFAPTVAGLSEVRANTLDIA